MISDIGIWYLGENNNQMQMFKIDKMEDIYRRRLHLK